MKTIRIPDKAPRCCSSIEPLEARIAPAAVYTFTDVDGDEVTIKTSKGVNDDLSPIITPYLVPSGLGNRLEQIDLSAKAIFAGTTLTITAKRGPTGGDGFVNIGYIDATAADGDGMALDLGAVSITGDVGKIVAGDATTTTPGVKSLTVQSLGRFGMSTGAPDLVSTITGALSALTVKSDVKDASVNTTGDADGKIGAVTIGGSLIGGNGANSGQLHSTGDIGMVKIGGDIAGGSGPTSGSVVADGKLAGLTLGGSLLGGTGGSGCGFIKSGSDMGMVKIGHDVRGAGHNSGEIACYGTLAGVTIGGSFIGGSGNFAGYIVTNVAGKSMGPVKIAGDIIGGSGIGAGYLLSSGKLTSVTVGGSLLGGPGSYCGVIRTQSGMDVGDMGAVKIGHDVVGGIGEHSGAIVSERDLAGVTIGGSVAGGAGESSGAIASGGKLGAVKIGGDMRGGSGDFSGGVNSEGKIASATLGGSLVGGGGGWSGSVGNDADLGPVKIGGDVRGGSGHDSGQIFPDGDLASVTIAGSLIGGTADHSGGIFADFNIGPVKIGGDIRGGSNSGAGSLMETGCIIGIDSHVTSITVGGSILAGTNTGGGTLTRSGAVAITGDLGSLTVTGSLIGNRVGSEINVVIAAQGNPSLSDPTKSDVAIGKVTIGGRVELAQILAGYDATLTAENADAQIGAVTVSGDWIASSIAAGVVPGLDGVFGTMDDAKMTGMVKDNSVAVSKIANILIKGQAFGTVGGMDNFGFVAQHVAAFKVGTTTFPLASGPGNDLAGFPVGPTADAALREIGI